MNGCVNVHGSLLPKYRGGAPIQRCIINGEQVTGVTLMYMAEGLDTGDMISRVEVPIGDEDTSGVLFEKLSLAGRDLLKAEMPRLAAVAFRLRAKTTVKPPMRRISAGKTSGLTGMPDRAKFITAFGDWSRSPARLHSGTVKHSRCGQQQSLTGTAQVERLRQARY